MADGSAPEFSFAAREDLPEAEGTDTGNGGMKNE